MMEPVVVLTVSNAEDQGYGSLRWALEKVDECGCSKIKIDPSVKRIQLKTPLPPIANDLEIEGCGLVIDGANTCQMMQVTRGRVLISDLTIDEWICAWLGRIEWCWRKRWYGWCFVYS